MAGGLHEPDPLRQSCHGCLQQVLARPGLQLSGYDAWMGIRDQEVHKKSRERGGEVESGEPFLFFRSGGFKSLLVYCMPIPTDWDL